MLSWAAVKIKYAAIANLQPKRWRRPESRISSTSSYPGPEIWLIASRMETAEGAIENPWITVSKRKRSRPSGNQYDATSKSEEPQEKLPTNGFLNLTLHESAADDENNGQFPDGTSNPEAARPANSEGAVPPRKKTKKDPKKVYISTQQIENSTVEISLSVNQAKRKRHKQTNFADGMLPLVLPLRVGFSRFDIVDAGRQYRPRMDRNPA